MQPTFAVGDTVHLPASAGKHCGTYTVAKVNPKTLRLEPTNGGRPVVADKHMVLAGPYARATVTIEEIPEVFDTGSVVTLKNVRGVDPTTLFVVTGSVQRGYRVFPLGGSVRYYTGIPAERLVRVTEITDWKAGA